MPQLKMPDGRVVDYPYTEEGMGRYRRDVAALELQQQQGQSPMPGQQAGPMGAMRGPQQGGQPPAQPGQMGYMQSMRQSPGATPHQSDDMAAWHIIYDLMNNPALRAQISAVQSQQLNQLVTPLRMERNHLQPPVRGEAPLRPQPPQQPQMQQPQMQQQAIQSPSFSDMMQGAARPRPLRRAEEAPSAQPPPFRY